MAVNMSFHACTRMSQRAVTPDVIDLALQYGRIFYAAGARHVFVAGRDVPAHLRHLQERLEGVTLVFSLSDDVLITVYRNRNASARIKRLDKTDRSRRRRAACGRHIA